MGEPKLQTVPNTRRRWAEGDKPIVNVPLEIDGQTLFVTTVSMGNPHAVTFVRRCENVSLLKRSARKWSIIPPFRAAPTPNSFKWLSDHEINFRVWERGAGATLACGTGACAAVVACVLNGKTGRRVLVHLPGGDLDIDWSEADNHVYMTGPATEVFEGEI